MKIAGGVVVLCEIAFVAVTMWMITSIWTSMLAMYLGLAFVWVISIILSGVYLRLILRPNISWQKICFMNDRPVFNWAGRWFFVPSMVAIFLFFCTFGFLLVPFDVVYRQNYGEKGLIFIGSHSGTTPV